MFKVAIINSHCGICNLAFQDFEIVESIEQDPDLRYLHYINLRKMPSDNYINKPTNVLIARVNNKTELPPIETDVIIIEKLFNFDSPTYINYEKHELVLNTIDFESPMVKKCYYTIYTRLKSKFVFKNIFKKQVKIKDIIDLKNRNIITHGFKEKIREKNQIHCIGELEETKELIYDIDGHLFNFRKRLFGGYRVDNALKRFNTIELKRIIGLPDNFIIPPMGIRRLFYILNNIPNGKMLYNLAVNVKAHLENGENNE